VGFVEEGRTFFTPHTFMISGAWPPPAPSLPSKILEESSESANLDWKEEPNSEK